MSSEKAESVMPHGWVENVLMDLVLYCAANGLENIADAIEPVLVEVGALNSPQVAAPPAAPHEGQPNLTQ
jgi:hypothetical protein